MSLQFSSTKAVKMGEIYYYEDSNAFVVDLVDNYEKAVQENEKLDRENKILRGRIKKLVKSCRELKDHIKKNEELGRLAKRIIEERTFQNGNY